MEDPMSSHAPSAQRSASSPIAEVLIVGAGPAGLACAAELLRQGVSNFRIIDALEAPAAITKGSGLMPRTLELLEHFPGVVPRIEKRAVAIHRAQPIGDDGKPLGLINMATKLPSKYNKLLFCEQWYTEECLRKYLDSYGKFVERGIQLLSFQERDSYVEVKTQRSSPTIPEEEENSSDLIEETILARYIVACDGARSSIRKQLNIDFRGVSLQNGFLTVHFKSKEPPQGLPGDALLLCLYKEGMTFANPMPEDTWIVGLDFTPEQERPFLSPDQLNAHGLPLQLDLTKEQMEEILCKRLSPGLKIEKVIWSTRFRVNERLSEKYWNGRRIFLAGDACHCHTPLGGQGMNTAIQDAVNIGWKLALVVRGDAHEDLLKSYELERKDIGKKLIEFTGRIQAAASFRNPILQLLRNHLVTVGATLQFIADIVAQTIGETAYHYKDSPLACEHWEQPPVIPFLLRRRTQNILRMITGRLKAGDRCRPDILSELDPEFFTRTCGFKAVVFEGSEKATDPLKWKSLTKLQGWSRELKDASAGMITEAIVVRSENNGEIYDAFGVVGQCVFLVRPDGYIGFRCEPLSIEHCMGYLENRICIHKMKSSLAHFRPNFHDWVPFLLLGSLATLAVATSVRLLKRD